MNYVIVGGGIATVAAVEEIRRHDAKGSIVVIAEEKDPEYSRPLISYLLEGRITGEKLAGRAGGFFRAHRVRLLDGRRAARLDVRRKNVALDDGRIVPFDRILIAVGARPLVPEIKGREAAGVFTFTRREDAFRIKKFIGENRVKEAVVVGGGLIGLKAAGALMELKLAVTVVELADRILATTFDRQASRIMERILKKKGCRVFAGTTVAAIGSGGGRVSAVTLADGRKIPARLVILAAGVVPAIELLKGTPVRTEKGIIVDEYMQTSVPGVFAAGDAVETYDRINRINRLIAIWPNAVRQGKTAGANMAGARVEYRGEVAMNAMEIGGVATVSVGLTEPPEKGYEIRKIFRPEEDVYKKLVLKDGKIVGAVFVGDISRAGIYTGLIREETDVSSFKDALLADDFGLLSLPKEYRKHLVSGWGTEV